MEANSADLHEQRAASSTVFFTEERSGWAGWLRLFSVGRFPCVFPTLLGTTANSPGPVRRKVSTRSGLQSLMFPHEDP